MKQEYKTLTSLPLRFMAWWWLTYADGKESPSYVRWDEMCEFGYSHGDYLDHYGEVLYPEIKNWLLENKSPSELSELLDRWIDIEERNVADYRKYYEMTKKELRQSL